MDEPAGEKNESLTLFHLVDPVWMRRDFYPACGDARCVGRFRHFILRSVHFVTQQRAVRGFSFLGSSLIGGSAPASPAGEAVSCRCSYKPQCELLAVPVLMMIEQAFQMGWRVLALQIEAVSDFGFATVRFSVAA
jgi:hypothetical protein